MTSCQFCSALHHPGIPPEIASAVILTLAIAVGFAGESDPEVLKIRL
ncbi:hypothetical protein [Trichocoleus sp. DQ-U1]